MPCKPKTVRGSPATLRYFYRCDVRLAVAVMLGVLMMATGCAWQRDQAPPVPDADKGITVQDGYLYRIAPGDQVGIFVWGFPDLSTTVPVRPDGMLTGPLIQDIQASDKTPSELAREIEKGLAPFVRYPVVSVVVNGFVGLPTQQVRVLGEAVKPRAVPFHKQMTLLDLMVEVGGLTDYAAGNKAVLVRSHDGKLARFSVKLDDLVRDGRVEENVSLLPGDVVIIPEAWF